MAKQVIALLNSDFRLDTPDQSKSVLMASRSIEGILRFLAATFEDFSKFCITNPQISQTWVSDFGYPIRNWKSRFWIPVQNPKLGFHRPDKSLSFLLFLFGQGRILHSIDFMQGNFFSDNDIQKLYKID